MDAMIVAQNVDLQFSMILVKMPFVSVALFGVMAKPANEEAA